MTAPPKTLQQRLLGHLWNQAWSFVASEMSKHEIAWLISPRHHVQILASRRTTMIVSRVQMLAGVFAVLTPLWIVLDVIAFEPRVWIGLMAARLAATVAFFALLWLPQRTTRLRDAYKALAMLLGIPTAFFIFSFAHMTGLDLHGVQQAFATGYAFLPFVMLAGLSVFPLTLTESLIFALPILAIQGVASLLDVDAFSWPTAAASFWLLLLITGVSALAGLSQLGFIIVLVREAVRDTLTGCFSRRSGEELLDLQFRAAQRRREPLALAFVDIDHFKEVNDRYGHDAGDDVLKEVASGMQSQARASDVLIRWGGEEFLLLMPNTDVAGAGIALERLRAAGIGHRPDGLPVTASIGLAERSLDGIGDWHALVGCADARMYQAKRSGRDRVVGPESE